MRSRFYFILASLCLCVLSFTEESSNDVRIKKLQEEIAIFRRRARFAEREAGRLWPLDITSARRYSIMQERNEQRAEELQRELDSLKG